MIDTMVVVVVVARVSEIGTLVPIVEVEEATEEEEDLVVEAEVAVVAEEGSVRISVPPTGAQCS